MATTAIVKNNNVESALKVLKAKNAKSGLLKDARERQTGYMKPGVKRRMAKKEAIKNARRREKNNNY